MTAKKKPTANNLESFRSEYDPKVRLPRLIQGGLASLLKEGRESWEYETDFFRRCNAGLATAGVGNSNIATYRDQFAKHIVEVRQGGKNIKRVWFADTKVAAQARGA